MTEPSLAEIKEALSTLEKLLQSAVAIRFPDKKNQADIEEYFDELIKTGPGKGKDAKELYEAAQGYSMVKELKAAISMGERSPHPDKKSSQAIQNMENVYNNPTFQKTIKSLSESKTKRFFTMIGHKLGVIKPVAQSEHSVDSVSKLQADLNKAIEKQRSKNVSFIIKR